MNTQDALTKSTNISFGQKLVSYLTENENENDVTFLVGSEQTEIKALKIALKAACPALDQMFKEVWEKGVKHDELRVLLPDLDPLAFRTFLKVLCWDAWDREEIEGLNLKSQTIVHLVEISKQLEMFQLQKVFSSLNRSYFSRSLDFDVNSKNPSNSDADRKFEKKIETNITSTGINTGGAMHVEGNVNVTNSIGPLEQTAKTEFNQIESPTSNFTGRVSLLERIHTRMQECSSKIAFQDRIVVLSGLGGIGKTETARMYATKYKDDSMIQNVAWIDAESVTTLEDGFYSLGRHLNLPSKNFKLPEIVNSVYTHFSDNIGVGLFIFDDAKQLNDSEFGIQKYLADSLTLKCRPLTLITSRDTKWEIPKDNIIAVDELTEGESVELVSKSLRLGELDQTCENKLEIVKLAHSLQGFPLGLCLAASNISYRNEKYFKNQVESYLKRMQVPTGGWIKDTQLGSWTKYKLVMENVWDTTLEKITHSQGGYDAIRLLNLMAFLPTDEINVETMSDLFSFAFGKPVTEKEFFILKNKSMILTTKDPTSLSVSASTSRPKSQIKIHRLVQHIMREKLDAQEDFSYLQHVCQYLSHMRIQNEEQYSLTAVLCAQEHLKNRNWPHDFIRYSVLFCSFMTFFEHGSPESTCQIFRDVYEFLGVEHMTTQDFKSEQNSINLFSLCVLWKNKNNKEAVISQSPLLANPNLRAEYFEEALLSLKSPATKIFPMQKMELDDLETYLYNHCHQKVYNQYKFTQIRWSRNIKGLPKKMRHVAVAVENQLFSFGGSSIHFRSKPDFPVNIFVLNLDDTEIKWKPIEPNHSLTSISTFTPRQRIHHTAVSYKYNVIIFGGQDYKLKELNSVCRFNIESLKWDEPNVTGTLPKARYQHSAVAIQNQMIIFGGSDSSRKQLNDVHSLNFDSFVWSEITTIKGTPSTRRSGHSAIVYKNRFIYIFGGYNNEELYLNDVICLDWNTKEWTRPETSGTIPQPRKLHSAFVHKGLMYIYGGQIGFQTFVNDLFSYNPETCKWMEVKPIGEPPSPRTDFGCVALNNSVYIFGGTKNYHDGLDDTFILDLE